MANLLKPYKKHLRDWVDVKKEKDYEIIVSYSERFERYWERVTRAMTDPTIPAHLHKYLAVTCDEAQSLRTKVFAKYFLGMNALHMREIEDEVYFEEYTTLLSRIMRATGLLESAYLAYQGYSESIKDESDDAKIDEGTEKEAETDE